MKITFIALLFSICLINIYGMKLTEIPIFSEIQKHPFGKTMLSLVENNLKKDSFDQVIQTITEMKDQMSSRSGEHDNNCEIDIANFETRIASLESALSGYKNQKFDTENLLSATIQRIDEINIEIPIKEEQLAQLQAAKEKDEIDKQMTINKRDQDEKDLNDAISACEQALKLLDQIKYKNAVASQIQLSNLIQKIDNLPKKSSSINLLQTVKPILKLAQTKTLIDPEAVTKVIALITNLKETIKSELATALINYNNEIDRLANEIIELNGKISAQISDLIDLNDELTQKTNYKNDLETQLQSIIAAINDTQAQLEAEERDYEIKKNYCKLGKENFASEISLLGQIIDILETKVKGSLSEENKLGIENQ